MLYPNVTNETQLKKASPPKQEAKSKSKRPSEKKINQPPQLFPLLDGFSFLVLLILIDFNKYGELIVPASIAFIALRKEMALVGNSRYCLANYNWLVVLTKKNQWRMTSKTI